MHVIHIISNNLLCIFICVTVCMTSRLIFATFRDLGRRCRHGLDGLNRDRDFLLFDRDDPPGGLIGLIEYLQRAELRLRLSQNTIPLRYI
jgi:hypothetical protein